MNNRPVASPCNLRARSGCASDAVGVSAFDTVNLSEQWILNTGTRLDSFDVTYHQYATNGTRTAFHRSDLEASWRSGLVYKPRPNGSIYFGYGTSFNPSAEGLTLATNNVSLSLRLCSGWLNRADALTRRARPGDLDAALAA